MTSVQVFHGKFSTWVCIWINHFSNVLTQQGWVRTTFSDYHSSPMCEIRMLDTPLANNSREQSFSSQDYSDRNYRTLIYFDIQSICIFAHESIHWLGSSADLSWSWLISVGRSAGSWLKQDVHGRDDSSLHSCSPAGYPMLVVVKAGFKRASRSV